MVKQTHSKIHRMISEDVICLESEILTACVLACPPVHPQRSVPHYCGTGWRFATLCSSQGESFKVKSHRVPPTTQLEDTIRYYKILILSYIIYIHFLDRWCTWANQRSTKFFSQHLYKTALSTPWVPKLHGGWLLAQSTILADLHQNGDFLEASRALKCWYNKPRMESLLACNTQALPLW